MPPETEQQSKKRFEEYYERYLKARTSEEMERVVAEYAEVVYSEEELQMREVGNEAMSQRARIKEEGPK